MGPFRSRSNPPPAAHKPQHQLQVDVTHRPGAADFRLHGDQRPGQAFAKIPLITQGFILRIDEIPPGDIFVLGEPALLTSGQEYQQTVDKEEDFVIRYAQVG